MKPKTMILMVVAVVCGLGASYMTSKLLAERGKEQTEPTVPVLVAKMRVNSWQPIRDPERMFEIRQFPVSVAPTKPLGDFPEILNQRLNKPIDEGKPVSQADLLTKDQYSMSENLLPGQRAIAIKVNPESLVGGFVLPGTRVDVVLTTKSPESASRIMLQNMLVMAVDMQDQRADGMKSMLGQTVTLAATPEEATRLALAATSGELRLLLKNGADTKRTYNVESKPEDFKRPLMNENDRESDAPRALSAAPPSLPEIKDDPRPAEPAPVVEKKPDPKKKKRFVMTIRSGLNIEKATFLLGQRPDDEDEDEETPVASPPKKDEEKKADPPKPAPRLTQPPKPTPFREGRKVNGQG